MVFSMIPDLLTMSFPLSSFQDLDNGGHSRYHNHIICNYKPDQVKINKRGYSDFSHPDSCEFFDPLGLDYDTDMP